MSQHTAKKDSGLASDGMRILIATPLYPPDIAAPAPYVKELAARLAGSHHVTVIAYGELPEPVAGVRIIGVSKRRRLPVRLFLYFLALFRAAWSADLVYAENGASVELPAALASFLLRAPLVLHLGDEAARKKAEHGLLALIGRFARARARRLIHDVPESRPEILPFHPYPHASFAEYERSWKEHLGTLQELFKNA